MCVGGVVVVLVCVSWSGVCDVGQEPVRDEDEGGVYKCKVGEGELLLLVLVL